MSEVALSRGQQLFVQRLLASHVMRNDKAQDVFDELQKEQENNSNATLNDWLRHINQPLKQGFDLEIVTVVMDKTQYIAIINAHNDEVAKKSFAHHFNPHERALIRLMVQKLVVDGTAARRDLINLRGDLQDPYKMTLSGAEHVVEVLLEEEWLRLVETDARRRESMQVSMELAPRSYLELSHLLMEMGIPQDDMPQFLFHRL
jgi:hypothetical protein